MLHPHAAPPPSPPPTDPGPVPGYRLRCKIGEGGAAEVFEAERIAGGERAAIKILRHRHEGDAVAVERMRFEAEALMRLRHPNVVAVEGFGTTTDGRPYVVMELLRGHRLLDVLRDRGCLPVPEAAELVQQLLAGLGAAHAFGIVHRDVKLENLFLCEGDGGRRALKILDFGIAKLLPGAAHAPPLPAVRSREGVLLGTPKFLSPEQALCRPVDARTDVYGACLAMYELVAGRAPFDHVDGYAELLQAHVSEDPRPPSALASQPIEPAVDDVILRGLAKRPDDRWASAAELSAALGRAVAMKPAASGRMTTEDPVSDPAWSMKPGDRFHQLEIVQPLGAGGHGEVYLVEHVHKNERFALKVMYLEDTNDAGKVRRALSTSKASYRVQHANVVRIEDLGCEPDGRVWVLMEHLDGASIRALLDRQEGRLSLPLAFHVAIEAAWGLDAAHELGIIHRDVKPDNVWLTRAGAVKVLDWSLAKVIPEGIQTTRRKTGFGTAPYMAPETLRGADPDARIDVYGLGIMLYEMIAGHPYTDAMRDTQEMIRRHLFVEPAPLSRVAGLPPYVDELLGRATAKDPARRFFSVAEMARAMIAVRDRLREDAERGLVAIEIPAGEPALVARPWARSEYQPPRAPPERETEPPAPSRRMVLPTSAVPLARTERLPGPATGLGGTIRMVSQWAAPVPPPALPKKRSSAPTMVLALAVAATVVAGGVGALQWARGHRQPPAAPDADAGAPNAGSAQNAPGPSFDAKK
jgi:serine/threonine-protein kinase